jgi:hypothetical protein
MKPLESSSVKKRNVVLAVAAAALFIVLRVALALTAHGITPARVSASAVLGHDVGFAPDKVVDRSTVETYTLRNFWLLPDRTPGWIRIDLDGEYRLDRLDILNTRNGLNFDRATTAYRIELIGPGGSSFIRPAEPLPAYPDWRGHDLPAPVVSAVVIHVDGFSGAGGGLDEVALTGRPAHGLGVVRDWLLALLATGLFVVVALRWPVAWRGAVTHQRAAFAVLALALVVVGQRLLRFNTAVSALEWGLFFDVGELTTFAKVRSFFANLMIPIPPVLALVEIAAQNLTGNNDFMIKTVYKVSIIGSYVGALALSYPRVGRMLATFAVSLLLMTGTAVIHPGNPQVYDTVYPFLVVAFLVSLSAALAAPVERRRRAGWLAVAGVCLSLLALTRPFAIFLVAAAVVFVTRRLVASRRHRMVFVLCAASLCVPWHAYLFVRHGQLTISNNAGFNLHGSWPMVPDPPYIPEDTRPPYRGLNNPQHVVNSNRIRNAIVAYVVTHPREAFDNLARRFEVLTQPKTVIIPQRLQPRAGVLALYQLVVRFLLLLMMATALGRLASWMASWAWLRRLRRAPPPAGPPQAREPVGTLLLALTAGSLLFSVGEVNEEARFIIALLPMLAVVPRLSTSYDVGWSRAAADARLTGG